jgi:hypothetical protein
MHAVAHALQGREIGLGLVGRVCREMQRNFFHPPVTYGGPPCPNIVEGPASLLAALSILCPIFVRVVSAACDQNVGVDVHQRAYPPWSQGRRDIRAGGKWPVTLDVLKNRKDNLHILVQGNREIARMQDRKELTGLGYTCMYGLSRSKFRHGLFDLVERAAISCKFSKRT